MISKNCYYFLLLLLLLLTNLLYKIVRMLLLLLFTNWFRNQKSKKTVIFHCADFTSAMPVEICVCGCDIHLFSIFSVYTYSLYDIDIIYSNLYSVFSFISSTQTFECVLFSVIHLFVASIHIYTIQYLYFIIIRTFTRIFSLSLSLFLYVQS